MIPIKIQCGCGQRYSFEAEPVCGRMPVAISCPVCGADGTTTANEVIAFHLALQMSVRNVRKDRVMLCTVLGCLAAGMVGVLKAVKMQGGFDVLLCLLGAVAAFGLVRIAFLGGGRGRGVSPKRSDHPASPASVSPVANTDFKRFGHE